MKKMIVVAVALALSLALGMGAPSMDVAGDPVGPFSQQ